MRRLACLALGSTSPLLLACTSPNPAFDDCRTLDDCVADGSETTPKPGDGDGDDDEPGDGDGEPGDGDGEPGDGDGEPGDGDGEPGDGDGDLIPTCPDTAIYSLAVDEDTFLDGSNAGDDGECFIGWDDFTREPLFAPAPCEGLDFGGAQTHWICESDICESSWLGRFEVGGFEDAANLRVEAASLVFTATVWTESPAQLALFELQVDPSVFQSCSNWMAGHGNGTPPAPCVTTYLHSAEPHVWGELTPPSNESGSLLGLIDGPVSPNLPDERTFEFALPLTVVEAWMTGEHDHAGVLLRGDAVEGTDFELLASESESPPELIVTVCDDAR